MIINCTDFDGLTETLLFILSTAVLGDVVVLDIDATVLFFSPDTSTHPCNAEVNPRGAAVYNLCIIYNIPVFFVTARLHVLENIEITRAQLRCLGFDKYVGLYMRPPHIVGFPAISQYKKTIRQQISRDFNILLNVGDMWSDLKEVPNEESMYALHRQSKNQHIPLKTDSQESALWALKLAESRD